MGVDSPRVPEAAQPEKVLVGAPDKERPDAREWPTLHILRVPMRVYSQDPDGEPRWCFVCRKRVAFTRTVRVPVEPMSYYGPSPSVECEKGHIDGDCFPGRWREWEEPYGD